MEAGGKQICRQEQEGGRATEGPSPDSRRTCLREETLGLTQRQESAGSTACLDAAAVTTGVTPVCPGL